MLSRIGRYRVDGPLGEGGMGVVYAAHDEALGRDVAVKVLREVNSPSRERLRREARAAAAVSHPNICHIYEVGEDGDSLFVAMERLAGEPLADRIARGAIPVEEAVPILLGILAALEALHARGIVHRDLKPANVFLTPHGVKLLDFGLAHRAVSDVTAATVEVTAAGLVAGTPRYMAPEQLQGHDAGPVTDQFAFGATMFEMLTGRPAFGGATVWDIANAILHGHPPALTGGPVAAGLDRVIRRCLAKRPEDRYPDPSAVARDIRGAATATDSGAMPPIRAATRLIVLPLRLLRADPDIDFLSFSLADSLIESLSGLGNLVVRSSQAAPDAILPDGSGVDLKRIASEAQVDAVLTGTLLRAGEQVRVVAQLVEAPGGAVLWSKTAQVQMRDVFQLQDDLARQIIDSLAIPLTAHERGRLRKDVPASGRAYELYLRANHVAHGTVLTAPLIAARELYAESLQHDPNFAPAWARLGRVCRVLAKYSDKADDENLQQAEQAFDRAFELNPELPLAHHLYTYFEVEQLARAEASMIRLLGRVRDVPNDPDLFAGLVTACRYCGLLEASLAADERARGLDPSLPTSVIFTSYLLGDLERVRSNPQWDAMYITGAALAQAGRTEEAQRMLNLAVANALPFERCFVDVYSAAMRGDRAGAERMAGAIRGTGFRDPEGLMFFAIALAHAGATDLALTQLEEVVEAGYTCPQIRNQPWLAPLAGAPRFERLIASAEDGRRRAETAFKAAGGPRLLGLAAHPTV